MTAIKIVNVYMLVNNESSQSICNNKIELLIASEKFTISKLSAHYF